MKKTIFLLTLSIFVNTLAFGQFSPTRSYRLESKSTGRYLISTTNTNLDFSYAPASTQNEWQIKEVGTGTGVFQILNVASGQALGINKNNIVDGAAAVTLTANTSSKLQKWTLTKVNNYYKLINQYAPVALTALNEYPTTTDPNPDKAYYDSYSNVGSAAISTDLNLPTQLFHIAPVMTANEEGIAIPQIGWTPTAVKTALYISNTSITAPTFTLTRKSDGLSVLSGTTTLWTATTTWGQFYYAADLTSISEEGEYTLTINSISRNVHISKNIYSSLKSNMGGTLNYGDFFNGFWNYNKFYPEKQTLNKGTLTLVNAVETVTIDGTYDQPTSGWFDAHSRDSKLGRTAKAVSDMCLAYFETLNSDNKTTLETQIKYGLQQLLETQNQDGSWSTGRVREAVAPRIYYNWINNVDVNTTARIVKTLALAYQSVGKTDAAYASTLMTSANAGWAFVLANESLVDNNQDKSWKGVSIDLLGAAIEMAIATKQQTYFDKADLILGQARYSEAIFQKEGIDTFLCESGNRYTELDNGVIASICRYANTAPTVASQNRALLLISDYEKYWNLQANSPFGFPQQVLDRVIAYGAAGNIARMGYGLMQVASVTKNQTTQKVAESCINYVLGSNPFGATYLVGVGDSSMAAPVSFFKRSLANGLGAIIPGNTYNGTSQVLNYSDYNSAEGVVPTSSTIFYLLSRLDRQANAVSSTAYNGDFELGFDNKWTLYTATTAKATFSNTFNLDIYEGLTSSKIQILDLPTPAFSNVRLLSSSIPVAQGQTSIDVSFIGKCDNTTGTTCKIGATFYDASNTKLSAPSSPEIALTNTYSSQTKTFTVPANTSYVVVDFRMGNVKDTYYLDNVIVGPKTATALSETRVSENLLYPNPAKDFVSIKAPAEDIESLVIYGLNGMKYSACVVNGGCDISQLATGIYTYVLTLKNGNVIRQKLIVTN